MKYLNENLIRESFLRLRETSPGGKKGLERTSALAVFLGFDALLKRTAVNPPIDLDADNPIGKTNRDGLSREVSRLVLVKNNGAQPGHVLNLGSVVRNGTTPEKRFSANFLTTALKSATTDSEASGYPSRPKPILMLGSAATGLTWGIDRHPQWKENLPIFLSERITKTPFHDLAYFALRQRSLESEAQSFQEVLVDGLREIFTDELCEYWKKKLTLEKPYMEAIPETYQDSLPKTFEDHAWAECDVEASQVALLTDRVAYLEGLLNMNHVEFDPQ